MEQELYLGDALRSYGVPADDLRVGTDMSDEEAEQAVKGDRRI